ncbi:hypothetical protein [Aeromicrobium sp. UC242_57]|uniref:hypothetical protein n=1 Tax=Aeromicrobium sp. UC242_57 TaxID=3374624 RepID=UPI0037A81621
MKIRPKLRSAGTCLLASALVVTLTQITTQSPASADDPVTVITSPPVDVGGGTQPPPLTVTVGNPVNGSASVIVDNPGGTAPTPKQCFTIEVTKETVCTGLSHDTVYPNGTFFSPEDVKITNAPTAPGGLPGDKMDWIIDEAYTVLADVHGVLNDDLVRSFARPDVRAYVEKRLNGIVNKKLYGKPMTDQENAAFEALEEYYKTNQVKAANAALAEYNLWTKNPCLYPVPVPPAGSGLPEVPNPVIGTIKCSAAARVQAAYTITNGTPPSETFEKWASYRHPKALVLHANDAKVRYMVGKTREAAIAVGVVGGGRGGRYRHRHGSGRVGDGGLDSLGCRGLCRRVRPGLRRHGRCGRPVDHRRGRPHRPGGRDLAGCRRRQTRRGGHRPGCAGCGQHRSARRAGADRRLRRPRHRALGGPGGAGTRHRPHDRLQGRARGAGRRMDDVRRGRRPDPRPGGRLHRDRVEAGRPALRGRGHLAAACRRQGTVGRAEPRRQGGLRLPGAVQPGLAHGLGATQRHRCLERLPSAARAHLCRPDR